MDLDSFLVTLYVLVDDWCKDRHPQSPRGPGRPVALSDGEVLTLAIFSQWPRWRSERDFWRFADVCLRTYLPNLVCQGQLNHRIRALEPELRALQQGLADTLADGSEVYRVIDTTLLPANVRVRACRRGRTLPARIGIRLPAVCPGVQARAPPPGEARLAWRKGRGDGGDLRSCRGNHYRGGCSFTLRFLQDWEQSSSSRSRRRSPPPGRLRYARSHSRYPRRTACRTPGRRERRAGNCRRSLGLSLRR